MATEAQNSSSGSPGPKLMLVDGSNLVFRMYYALEHTGLTAPDGRPSWAIFGFFKNLLDAIERERPAATVTVFDHPGENFRDRAYDYYKANRPAEMPEALSLQWPEIERGMDLMGMDRMAIPGFEADDTIGTLADKAKRQSWQVVILSGDRDNLQLVDDSVSILMPTPRSGLQLMGRDEVYAKLGVYPEQVVDFKALSGDSSDNIPGVAGIGDKTATKLLRQYRDLDDIYAHLDDISSRSLRSKLQEGRDKAYESQFLARIRIDCEAAELPTQPLRPDLTGLATFLTEYKLDSLRRRLVQAFPELSQLEERSQHDQSQRAASDNVGSTDADIAFFGPDEEPPPSSLEIERRTITDPKQLQEVLAVALGAEMVALDLETDGLDTWNCRIVGWALGWRDPNRKGVEISSLYAPDSPEVSKAFGEFLRERDRAGATVVLQNLKFEHRVLYQRGLRLPRRCLDTMLASYVENPDQRHGLKAQALRVFGYRMAEITDLIGPKGKKQLTMAQVPVEQVAPYACDDAALTLALGEHYEVSLPEASRKLWQNVESPLAAVLADMELTGVAINLDKLRDLSGQLEGRIRDLQESIEAKLETPNLNINSTQQLASALSRRGFRLQRSTSSGRVATDQRVLEDLKSQDESGVVSEIEEFRHLSKLHSTYVQSLAVHGSSSQRRGRVHCEFNQAQTSTGRLSSSNPNLQNIPVRDEEFGYLIRSCFEAPTGKVLLAADYSQIELRLLAHFTEDPTLCDAFDRGQDIHSRTAAEVFEVSAGEVNRDMRRLGKTLNFALIYQQGAQATGRQLGITTQEASRFMETYFRKFPRVKPFLQEVLEQARDLGYVETIWGRRRFFRNLRSKSMGLRRGEERAAFNAPLQGSAADMIKIAMLRVQARLGGEDKLLLQVHDELVLEVPEERSQKVAEILAQEMVIDQPLKVPVEVEIKRGPNWADCRQI